MPQLDTPTFTRCLPLPPSILPRIAFDDAHGSLAHLFTSLLREYQSTQSDSAALIGALTTQLDILLLRTTNQTAPKIAEIVVREAEILWEEAPEQSWRIETTAHSLGISPSQLRADFAAVRGQSPTEILRAIRVRHALSLLAHSEHSLEVVAQQSGFHSASHLSRHIKAQTGQAPGKWRLERGF